MNRTMTIEYNDEMLQALALSPKKFQEMVRIHLAVKLYELGGLSTGGAAEFAGMPKTTFLSRMSEYGLDTFDFPADELVQDVANARRYM